MVESLHCKTCLFAHHMVIVDMLPNQLSTKGQLISKVLFGVFDSSKKWTKKFDLTSEVSTMIPVVFVCFLEELITPKSPFEIKWPLWGTIDKKGVFAEQVFVLGEQLNCL